VVASVINGEAIPMIQNRVEDVGFTDLDIIPLGADKNFIRSLLDSDVMKTVKEASEFFNLLLTNIVHWDKTVVPFHKGALLRLYGIPLHAWNESFLNYVLWSVDDFYGLTTVLWRRKGLIMLGCWFQRLLWILFLLLKNC
jgi:hypothetical protein